MAFTPYLNYITITFTLCHWKTWWDSKQSSRLHLFSSNCCVLNQKL